MRLLPVLAAALIASTLAFTTVAQAGDPGTPHRPDLQTLPPADLHIQRVKGTGEKLLRFSNAVANLGDGRLELFAVVNPVTGQTDAYQRVYTHDAGGAWSIASTTLVGSFSFAGHETHNHWHFDDFALYELRNVASDGSVGATVLASSDKVTFCIVDTTPIDLGLPHAAPRSYLSCNITDSQGLSVGWGDTYTSNLAGQWVDITGVPSGTYYLVSTADPDNRLFETSDANNAAAVKIRIKGNGVKILP